MSFILLLEDDLSLGKNLKLYLETHDYQVNWVKDLRSSRAALLERKPDLMLLDWSLPDGTGFEFFKSLEKGKRAVALFLTAREDEDSAIQALTEGAIDYIRKPFGQGELLVKIKKALGEAHNPAQKIRFLDIQLDLAAHKAFYKGEELKLRRREIDLLELLIKKSDQVVTREDVLSLIEDDGEIFDRTVDSHMSRLRKAFKQAHAEDIEISSVYGVGYQLRRKAK